MCIITGRIPVFSGSKSTRISGSKSTRMLKRFFIEMRVSMSSKLLKLRGSQPFTFGFLVALLFGVCQMTAWAGDSQSLEFTRLKGKPTLMEKTLTVVSGTFELVATTGMGGVKDGILGASSADVFVNGVQIWSENDFKPPFTRLTKTVTLKASNVIGVKINGKPGSWISLGFGSAPAATIGFSTAISSKTEGQPASVTVALSAANTNVVSVGYTLSGTATNNADYTFLGIGTATGSNWILSGLNLPTGQNIYIRARGFYRTGYLNGSESITESVRAAFLPSPPPLLNIQRSANTNVVLSWATNFSGFTLESKTNLNTNVWSTVSPAPVASGTNNVVTNVITGSTRFYRLRK